MTDKVLGIYVHKMINDVTYSYKNFMLPVSFKGEEHTYWFCPFCWDVFKNNRENKPERHVLYYHGGESKVINDKFLRMWQHRLSTETINIYHFAQVLAFEDQQLVRTERAMNESSYNNFTMLSNCCNVIPPRIQNEKKRQNKRAMRQKTIHISALPNNFVFRKVPECYHCTENNEKLTNALNKLFIESTVGIGDDENYNECEYVSNVVMQDLTYEEKENDYIKKVGVNKSETVFRPATIEHSVINGEIMMEEYEEEEKNIEDFATDDQDVYNEIIKDVEEETLNVDTFVDEQVDYLSKEESTDLDVLNKRKVDKSKLYSIFEGQFNEEEAFRHCHELASELSKTKDIKACLDKVNIYFNELNQRIEAKGVNDGKKQERYLKFKNLYFTFIETYRIKANRLSTSQIDYVNDLLADFCGLVFNSTVPSEVSLSHTSVLSRNISINIVSLELLKEYYNSCICYSLIFDETENNGVVKLGLKARFSLEDGKFVQPTISLCTFYEKCKSFNLTKWLLSTLKKKCLNLDKCIGLCTDGAKVMKGKIKGVSKLLHDIIKKKRNATNSVLKINEDITCLAHKENLCLKEFCKNDYMKLQLKFVHWLTQNCIIRQWNVYAKKIA